MKVAAGVAEAAQPVASARQGLPPAEEVAAVSGAKVRPRAAAEVLPVPSVRPPGVAEAVESAVPVQPPEAAVPGLDAAEQRPAEAAAVQPDGEAARLPAAVQRGVGEPQPEEAQRARVPSVRQRAAAPPFAAAGLASCRLPWLAPRQAVRSAHAMRRSRVVSPSRRSWRAARCEAWS
jgi:hypothetical protein